MTGYDRHLFIEIIQNEGARFHDYLEIDGYHIEWYIGPSGVPVQMMIEDDFITNQTARELLNQLGMEDLIPRLGL